MDPEVNSHYKDLIYGISDENKRLSNGTNELHRINQELEAKLGTKKEVIKQFKEDISKKENEYMKLRLANELLHKEMGKLKCKRTVGMLSAFVIVFILVVMYNFNGRDRNLMLP